MLLSIVQDIMSSRISRVVGLIETVASYEELCSEMAERRKGRRAEKQDLP